MSPATEVKTQVDPRYPVGKFQRPDALTIEQREAHIATLAGLPEAMRQAVSGLSDAQLDTPYRNGGWTVRQLVHHVADSHEQMVGRMKLALTEDCPMVKTYDEAAWAELKDARTLPIELSLGILDGLHTRAVVVLRSLSEEQWQRCFSHPEWGKIKLEQTLALYAWHSRHHVAHVTELRKRMGW
jgi:uncharacterized damage-inducible protein DinB